MSRRAGDRAASNRRRRPRRLPTLHVAGQSTLEKLEARLMLSGMPTVTLGASNLDDEPPSILGAHTPSTAEIPPMLGTLDAQEQQDAPPFVTATANRLVEHARSLSLRFSESVFGGG